MNVKDAVLARRAYRSLEPAGITEGLIKDLAECASLAPSCFNHQPWRYCFVYGRTTLGKMNSALSKGNEWARQASMIIAVYSRLDYDCEIKGREYYLFDTGLSTAFLVLRATELGLVAHPIAGFDEDRVKEILDIPEDMKVITLVIVGKHSMEISPLLSEKQAEAENNRPERLDLEGISRIYR